MTKNKFIAGIKDIDPEAGDELSLIIEKAEKDQDFNEWIGYTPAYKHLDSLASALYKTFAWRFSPEGPMFWCKVMDKLEGGQEDE